MPDQRLATRDSCENHPMPKRRERIAFQRTFTPEEFARIRRGCVPLEMEDKWFVFFEDNWLYFHRSWTGHCIFQLKLEEDTDGGHVVEAWVGRDTSQYKSRGGKEDLKMLSDVLRWSMGI